MEKLTLTSGNKSGVIESSGANIDFRDTDAERIVGIDKVDGYIFVSFISGLKRLEIQQFRFNEMDNLSLVKNVAISEEASLIQARKVIFTKGTVVILDNNRNLFVYNSSSDEVHQVKIDGNRAGEQNCFISMILMGRRLFIFDYYQCPIEEHNFKQPFSKWDKIRVFDLTSMTWTAEYSAYLNRYRRTGHNELLDFEVQMYIIRSKLFFSWKYNGCIYLFSLNEESGEVVMEYQRAMRGQVDSGFVLLPGYVSGSSCVSRIEKYLHEFCIKNISTIYGNEEKIRLVEMANARYLDGVFGNCFFP